MATSPNRLSRGSSFSMVLFQIKDYKDFSYQGTVGCIYECCVDTIAYSYGTLFFVHYMQNLIKSIQPVILDLNIVQETGRAAHAAATIFIV